jgi:signal transduction histidine kinase
LPPEVHLSSRWPDDLPPVLADADQLRIVFANLVRNAREAMPRGGTLALTARLADGHVHVEVADTGIGIPADQLARIMEPLFTTKARGLGLGLALARAILEKNRGGLLAASTPGQGTTFTVRLTPAITGH